jgi:hypothetical protein
MIPRIWRLFKRVLAALFILKSIQAQLFSGKSQESQNFHVYVNTKQQKKKMFKSQLEGTPQNFEATAIFVENVGNDQTFIELYIIQLNFLGFRHYQEETRRVKAGIKL